MINKVSYLFLKLRNMSKKDLFLLIVKILIWGMVIIFMKVPILLLRIITLDIVYKIFENLIIANLFYWLYELLYYLIAIVTIKNNFFKNTANN